MARPWQDDLFDIDHLQKEAHSKEVGRRLNEPASGNGGGAAEAKAPV